MRLSTSEQIAIVSAVKRLDPSGVVYLFGSRANDNLKGGDLDLIVVSDTLEFRDKIALLADLKAELGDQKIDLILTNTKNFGTDPFIQSVISSACRLN